MYREGITRGWRVRSGERPNRVRPAPGGISVIAVVRHLRDISSTQTKQEAEARPQRLRRGHKSAEASQKSKPYLARPLALRSSTPDPIQNGPSLSHPLGKPPICHRFSGDFFSFFVLTKIGWFWYGTIFVVFSFDSYHCTDAARAWLLTNAYSFCAQHKLGRGSRDKVQQFMAITGTRYIFFNDCELLRDRCLVLNCGMVG